MKILNCITETEVRQACFQCEYKGFTISCSNMFGKYETILWSNEDPKYCVNAASVPDAIDKIKSLSF